MWGVLFDVTLDQHSIDGFAATYYHGVMATALRQFKDHEQGQVLPFLLHALDKIACGIDFGDAVILPVPTTDERLALRGFYPVGVLARYLSALTGSALYDGLVRHSDGRHQRGLSKSERLANVKDVFLLEYPPPTNTVTIFDDVATTGATIKAVAQTLLETNRHLSIKACCVAHGKPK